MTRVTHEFLDDTVEDDTIVITILDVRDEILNSLRCDVGIQLDELEDQQMTNRPLLSDSLCLP